VRHLAVLVDDIEADIEAEEGRISRLFLRERLKWVRGNILDYSRDVLPGHGTRPLMTVSPPRTLVGIIYNQLYHLAAACEQ
jgi:hypothetical protein